MKNLCKLYVAIFVLDKSEEALNLPPEAVKNSTCYSPVRMKKLETYDY